MALNIENTTIIKQNKSIIASEIDNEVVMMSMENGEYYGLNNIASVIWSLLQQGANFQQLIGKLILEYEVDETTCKKDVLNILEQLYKKKLIILE